MIRGMSDADFARVTGYEGFIDVIDEEWQNDVLSDEELEVFEQDDTELNEVMDLVQECNSEAEGGGEGEGGEAVWDDLALDLFRD